MCSVMQQLLGWSGTTPLSWSSTRCWTRSTGWRRWIYGFPGLTVLWWDQDWARINPCWAGEVHSEFIMQIMLMFLCFFRISCVLQKIVSLNIPVIIDGDGLWHIVHQPSTLRGYSNAVITPNSVELGYLHKTFCGNASSASSDTDTCSNLATALGNITVMAKGPHDIITNGRVTISCSSPGSPR